ncbi:MAG: ethanolamine permease [Polyangiaceae bacterium]|nr:ethanolamine permease [Polyangiaceae bacterium]
MTEEAAASASDGSPALKRTLGPVLIWALGVGYVISGMYFGWNLGLPEGGTLGMGIATAIVTVLYVTFVLAYAELGSAIPRAGGAFVYASRAFGERVGLLAGVAQWVEFVFAPPAIAAAIGAYFQLFFPSVPKTALAIGAYVIFTAVNAWGVALSAMLELLLTVLAVGELLVYFAMTGPRVSYAALANDALPHGAWGVFAALPFAVWFYLGIEGITNVSEEAKRPERDIPRGFVMAMGTLVVLAFAVLICSAGIAGWPAVVYPPGGGEASDSPLPLALGQVVGPSHLLFHLLVLIGLFGLVASFHGIVLAAGRVTMEFGRAGYLPRVLGRVHPKRRTPVPALLLNMACGIVAILSGKTGDLINLSVLGALVLYALASLSMMRLRRSEPDLVRPFRVPLYPLVPIVAAALSVVCAASVVVAHPLVGLTFVGVVAVAFVRFLVARR